VATSTLGRRDGLSQIDAFVLSLDAFMTPAELDAIFSRLAGDYNGDGSVDAADYAVWRKTLGQEVAPFSGADGNGSGVVDAGDYAKWRANFGANAAVTDNGAAASAAVPEPSALTLFIAALLAAADRASRRFER